jgi:hypothetical protein
MSVIEAMRRECPNFIPMFIGCLDLSSARFSSSPFICLTRCGLKQATMNFLSLSKRESTYSSTVVALRARIESAPASSLFNNATLTSY